jgi:hypothetical protein
MYLEFWGEGRGAGKRSSTPAKIITRKNSQVQRSFEPWFGYGNAMMYKVSLVTYLLAQIFILKLKLFTVSRQLPVDYIKNIIHTVSLFVTESSITAFIFQSNLLAPS